MLNWLEKHNWISWIIVIVLAFVIFYLSALPSSSYPSGLGIMTKIYHVTIFFLLALFLSIAIVRGKKQNINLIYLAIIIAIFYGLTDEAHQLFVPGRSSAVTDVLIDSIGILAAGIVYGRKMKIYATSKIFLNIEEKTKLPIK